MKTVKSGVDFFSLALGHCLSGLQPWGVVDAVHLEVVGDFAASRGGRVESWKRRPDEPVRADPAEVEVGVSVPEQVEVVVFYEHAQLE